MRRRPLMALGLGLLATLAAQAQENFPNRPIHWIVPYLAGTSPDNTVRIVAEAMAVTLKQTIVVENKPGAAGNLGAQAAARAAPDGLTWVYSGSPMSSSMRMYRQPGFDVMKDFVHVGRIGVSDLTVVTSPGTGITSLRELIERARKAPDRLTYASGGIGSPAHLAAELMLSTAGVTATHVPFKGAPEAMNAVIGKQVDFAVSITSVALPHVQNGKLAALAVSSPQRHARLPKVPTLAEAGVPVTVTSVGGLSVPAGTPQPIVRRVSEALNAALNRPDVKARIEALGGRVVPSSPDEYATALRQEITAAEKLMAAARLEPQ